MSFIIGANSAVGGLLVDNSCRFESGDSAYLTRTCGSTASSYTVSMWVKTANSSGTATSALWWNAANSKLNWELNDKGQFYYYDSGTPKTTGYYRDTAAWYHLVFKVDSNTGTLYINGAAAAGITGIGSILSLQTGNALQIGKENGSTFDGYMAEVCFIDGTALNPDQFGEFDGDSPTIWKPIDVSGLTFGTKGFYLDFEDSSDLGKDVSGNGNDLTATNLVATDQTTDTPVNNFATLNPLYKLANITFTEGNLVQTNSGSWQPGLSTIGVSSGKWYWESKFSASTGGSNNAFIGICKTNGEDSTINLTGNSVNSWGYENTSGYKNDSTVYATSDYAAWTVGDIVSCYLDLDNLKLYFAKDGVIQNSGTGIAITAGNYVCGISTYYGTMQMNYGNPAFAITSGNTDAKGYGNFEYSPNDGGSASFDSAAKDFLALNTKNVGAYGG